jgi:beta propeller repeat protein
MDSDNDTVPNYLDTDTGSPDPAKIRITDNISDQLEPEIYEDKIVWEDERHGNYDIYMYDLSEDSDFDSIPNYLDNDDDGDDILDMNDPDPDSAEIQITDSPAHQEKPSIFRNKLVWVDKRYGNQDLFIYDIESEHETILIGHNETGEPKWRPKQDYPRIHGDYVVWQDDRNLNYEIYYYNLTVDSDSDGIPNYLDVDRPEEDYAEQRITTTSVSEFKPVIYENRIAYTRTNDIYIYDIKSKMEYKVTQSTPSQKIDSRPCNLYGNKLTWTYYEDSYDIYLYDLSEDTDSDSVPNYMDSEVLSTDPALKRITNESEVQVMLPVIYADKIVWQDSRNTSKPADRDIYVFSITENMAPHIDYALPNYDPQIEEGEILTFIIEADDPEGEDLNYMWFFNRVQILNNDTHILEFISDYSMIGTHEIRVVVSDSEYPLEHIWTLTITESGIEPIEIFWVEPVTNPQIIEGDEIRFRLKARFFSVEDTNASWIFPEDSISAFTPTSSGFTISGNMIFADAIVKTKLEPNGSFFVSDYDISFLITSNRINKSFTWDLSIIYFDDADFDGYSDALEITWDTDPKDPNSFPTDKDKDLIVDAEDDDIDGDGFLDKYDADVTNSNKQLDGNPDYSVEILIIIISIVLLVASLISLSKAQAR